jgi:uncharacterized protein (TIGR00266 family)
MVVYYFAGRLALEYEIIGDNLQMVLIKLGSGEMVYGEAGAMNHMSDGVDMSAKATGGILGGIKRKLSGESFFLTEFKPKVPGAYVAFAGNVPGKIIPMSITPDCSFIAQKDAFLCAESGVKLDITLTRKLTSGFFGGEGFILEQFTGNGMVFLHAAGDMREVVLQSGEKIKVDTGSVVGFDSSVDYSIERAGNLKTMIFGGEGLFLTTLIGPGRVIIQSMTLANMAYALRPFLGTTSSSSGGSFIGDLIGD